MRQYRLLLGLVASAALLLAPGTVVGQEEDECTLTVVAGAPPAREEVTTAAPNQELALYGSGWGEEGVLWTLVFPDGKAFFEDNQQESRGGRIEIPFGLDEPGTYTHRVESVATGCTQEVSVTITADGEAGDELPDSATAPSVHGSTGTTGVIALVGLFATLFLITFADSRPRRQC